MGNLQSDWLTNGLVDFEYKKYVVLGYLKDVKKKFSNYKLYPFLSDLVFHYQNLKSIKENKKVLYKHFPTVMTRADFQKLKLNYKKIVEEDEIMKIIEDILAFSIPHFKDTLEEGSSLFDFIQSKIEISTIGISPIYFDEGYMLINQGNEKKMKVFSYKVTVFENQNEKYRGMHTEFLEDQRKSLVNTCENIKMELIKRNPELPNPATYLVHSQMALPFNQTLLPVAKRLLLRHIHSEAA